MQYPILTIINTILLQGGCSVANFTYETHIMSDPLLPFIFHRDTSARQETLSNWHENIEILYATSGAGYVNCNTEHYTFRAQDIFVVNSDSLHATGSDSELVYHCLIIDKSFCESNGIPTSQIRFRALIQDPELSDTFCRIAAAFDRYSSSSDRFAVSDIRYEVLGLLRRLCREHIVSSADEAASISSDRVKKAIVYIKTHMTDTLSLQEISDHVGISRFHLSREFKLLTGRTIFDTVNLIRCAEARRMIEHGASVSEAAISCGFENLSYFSRTFKKHFGELPSKYLIH